MAPKTIRKKDYKKFIIRLTTSKPHSLIPTFKKTQAKQKPDKMYLLMWYNKKYKIPTMKFSWQKFKPESGQASKSKY